MNNLIYLLKREISLKKEEVKHKWYEILEYETGENTDRLDGIIEGLELALNLIERRIYDK